jgi:hypothetical protein
MIIFLDFDGVLHSNEQYDESPFCRTHLLWQILRACPKVQVVFSTSWRDSYDFDNMLDFVTSNGGEDLTLRFISSTPNLEAEGHYGRRDLEIQRWLDVNMHSGHWLAIDDMAELFSGHSNLYLVDGNIGLTDADVIKIVELLNSKSSLPEDDPLVMFSRGLLTKDRTVEMAGLRDYAELLVAMGDAGLPLPSLPKDEIEKQVAIFAEIWKQS